MISSIEINMRQHFFCKRDGEGNTFIRFAVALVLVHIHNQNLFLTKKETQKEKDKHGHGNMKRDLGVCQRVTLKRIGYSRNVFAKPAVAMILFLQLENLLGLLQILYVH